MKRITEKRITEFATYTPNGSAQVSVYRVATCKRIRTMLFPGSKGNFVACCFSGDNRWLITVAAEPDGSIVVWNWDKEKVVD